MSLSDTLISKIFMNLEMFLKKAAALDIFDELKFNYKVKIGLLDPVAIHFVAIVTELSNQLQISELSERKSESHEPVLLSVKSDDFTTNGEPLVFSFYEDSNHHLTEVNFSTKNYQKVPKDNIKITSSPKQRQRILKPNLKKSEGQGKLDRKNVVAAIKDNKSFKCNFCGSNFTTEVKLTAHLPKCQKNVQALRKGKAKQAKVNKCNFCDLEFTLRRSLINHINNLHKAQMEMVKEEVSDASYAVSDDSIIELTEILLLPENLPFFCCRTCLAVYKTHKEFETHICKIGGNSCEEGTILDNYIQMTGMQLFNDLEQLKSLKKYKCGLCHEEYRSIPRMSYHLPRCTQGPYKCELCTEEYTFKKDLNLHKKKAHKGANSFFCDECGLTFKFRTSLQKHKVNRHETDQGPYSCEECGENYTKRIHLTNHKINIHGIERKFLCQVCGNKFSSSGSLAAHLETHTETRKFSCRERPHLCQTCGKGFIRKSKLDEHIRRHRGEKRYHCSICNKSYAAAWDLKLHNRKQHPHLTEEASEGTSRVSSARTSGLKSDSDPDDPDSDFKDENKTKNVDTHSDQGNSTILKEAQRSKLFVNLNATDHQSSHVVVPSGDAGDGNSTILLQLNPTHSQSSSVSQEGTIDNSNSSLLVQVEHTQLPNQPLLLNDNTNNNNSKIIVQVDAGQQSRAPTETAHSNSANNSSSSGILVKLEPTQQNAQTIIPSGSAAGNSSRFLLQLEPGQNQPLSTNTLLAVADAIHLAPLVEEVNNINLTNVSAQYIQLTAAPPDETVPSNSAIANGNDVPLHIQLPVSAVPLSVLSQHGSGTAAYELQSLSVQGQTGLVFTSTELDPPEMAGLFSLMEKM
ncbi:hypothetical protein C0J52_11491 [Blattella germanica]|nr:hypothetical protein C0J52_11491 [Blattella germanica]